MGQVHGGGERQGKRVDLAAADDHEFLGAGKLDGALHGVDRFHPGEGNLPGTGQHQVAPPRQGATERLRGLAAHQTGLPSVSALKRFRSSARRQGSWLSRPIARRRSNAATRETIGPAGLKPPPAP